MAQNPGKRCDDFVLCDCGDSTTGIYVIERKSGKRDVSEVAKQLQSGANFICRDIRQSDQFDFLPVLVAKGIPSSSRNQLRNKYICLGRKKRQITYVKPKVSLKNLSQRGQAP